MNPTPAAAFVTVIALGVLFAFAAAFGFWLVDTIAAHFGRSEWQELDDHERAQAALRHPSAGGES